jgi:hypothetical protein
MKTKEQLEKQFIEELTEATNNRDKVEMTPESLGPWSISKLKLLQKCPFAFYTKYVVKVKLPKELQAMVDTTMADIGSSAHKILESLMFGKSLSQSYSIAKHEFVDGGKLTPQQWAEKIVPVETNIVSFKERIEAFERSNPIKRVLTELRIGVTKDWEPTGFFGDDVYMRGVIDLSLHLENNDLVVIDHKFGGSSSFGLRNYEMQLKSYKPLYHFGIGNVRGAQSGVHWIAEGDVKLGDYHDRAAIEGTLKNEIEFMIQGAIDGVTENHGYFKHVSGSMCQYCEFRDPCKAKQLLPIEKTTKKFFEIKKID